MAYWHTGAPNRGDEFGWLGCLADALDGASGTDVLINIAQMREWKGCGRSRYTPALLIFRSVCL